MSLVFAMCIYSLSMSISPGPVNLIALSSGVNYGFRRSFSYVSGATIGFTLLLLVIGLGLVSILQAYPKSFLLIGLLGAGCIFYMGYKVALAKPSLAGAEKNQQPSFFMGFVLQWLNPKAWIACVSGVSAFVAKGSVTTLFLFCAIYFSICYVSIACWALLGEKVYIFLRSEFRLTVFNRIMGLGLILVAIYLSVLLLVESAV